MRFKIDGVFLKKKYPLDVGVDDVAVNDWLQTDSIH